MMPAPLALVADRDSDARRMYAEYLHLQDWRVDEAADGREALAKALAIHPDIIVTETRLFGMNGYDLCAVLRRDVETRSIPIVVVTGDAMDKDVARARRAGADALLIKPCLPDTLFVEIRRLLTASRELRRRANLAQAHGREQIARSEQLLQRASETRPRMLSHVHERRETTTPPIDPPRLICPGCDRALVYRSSHLGGVSEKHPEQWDYYVCPSKCGTFQFRQRTRKLRKVS
jgi:CheY-like chemotaxis protein